MKLKYAILLLFCNVCWSAQIYIEKEVDLEGTNYRSSDINDRFEHKIIVENEEYGEASIIINFADDNKIIYKKIKLMLYGPPDYSLSNYNVNIPFYSKNQRLDFLLYGKKIEIKSDQELKRMVWKLWQSPVMTETYRESKDIFRDFVKSYTVARYIKENYDPRDTIKRHQCRGAFIFLRSARELAYHFYIFPDTFTLKMIDFLETAYNGNQSVCSSANGTGATQQLLTQVRNLDAWGLAKIRSNILLLQDADYNYYCKLTLKLNETLRGLTLAEKSRYNQAPGTRNLTALVADESSDCLWNAVYGWNDIFKNSSLEEVVNTLRTHVNTLPQEIEFVEEWAGKASSMELKKSQFREMLRSPDIHLIRFKKESTIGG